MPQQRTSKRYGYLPDLADHRDIKYGAVRRAATAPLPPSMDLRSGMPPVVDQLNLSSCTANALCAAVSFLDFKEGITPADPLSRLMLYYDERVIENSVYSDGGAMIRDGIKSLASQGVCSEESWPYVAEALSMKPAQNCYDEAALHVIAGYARIQTLEEMKACLASGYPFVAGFSVYTAFESDEVARTGVLNLPAPSETLLGGHAVLTVGFRDDLQRFIVRNSWGTGFGDGGHFTVPYSYWTNPDLASDFWYVTREANF